MAKQMSHGNGVLGGMCSDLCKRLNVNPAAKCVRIWPEMFAGASKQILLRWICVCCQALERFVAAHAVAVFVDT